MRNKQGFLFVFLLFLFAAVHAQEKSKIKYGDVTAKDFDTKIYPIDSNANAVVIADIGSSVIEGNSKGWFSFVFKHFKRIHILNKNAYDLANVSIRVYASTDGSTEEQLDKLKAVTYNLENGKVVESKLDVKNNVFKDKLSKTQAIKKFTFPNVKEGSIIEYEFTIISDFLFYLRPWEFQGSYPRLWSEYNLSLPEFMGYVFLTQGYRTYDFKDAKERMESFRVIDRSGTGPSDRFDFTANVTDYKWIMKNVPALKEENFTSTLDNHIAKIEFQLSEYRRPVVTVAQAVMGTWDKLAENLMKDEDFGYQLGRDNGWLDEITDPLVKGVSSKIEKARKIYTFLRDNYTCTDHSARSMSQTMRNLVKTKNGSVAEINLFLAALLKHVNLEADPVILSTRANGYTLPLYPLFSRFNYVIAKTNIDGTDYFLDASEPGLGFGRLPLRCYNGHARIIRKTGAEPIQFSTDSVAEKKYTTVFIINDEKGNIVGSYQQTPGYYESMQLRNNIKDKGKDQFIKDMKKAFNADIEISNPQIDSLDKYDNELGLKYDFELKEEKGDIIYLNPMFGEGFKENPFKSAERFYPVEMPYTMDKTYNLQLEVPQGYIVDEMPKPLILKLNEQDDGLFEYRISESGGNIAMRCRIRINRTYYAPEEYELLREFFNMIVSKQNEQIVFKKKK